MQVQHTTLIVGEVAGVPMTVSVHLGERAVALRGIYESVRYGILNILKSLRKKFVEYKFDLVVTLLATTRFTQVFLSLS
jgi:hypothetical protein